MKEAAGSEAGNVTVELELVAEVVSQQLASMLSVGNYDAVKLLLKPVQPVDIAEAIGNLPTRNFSKFQATSPAGSVLFKVV